MIECKIISSLELIKQINSLNIELRPITKAIITGFKDSIKNDEGYDMPIEYIILFKIIPQSNNMKESNFSRLFEDSLLEDVNQVNDEINQIMNKCEDKDNI